jgi:acetyl-CoA C-acetyltransferase
MNSLFISKRLFSKRNVVIVGCKRTIVGSHMGALSNMTGPHLGMIAARGAIASSNIDAKDIEEVYMGNVL